MADNKLLSLTEIFNQKFFRIPDFQRGYSWTREQLDNFWEDIVNLKDDRIHYTGLLTVEPIGKSDFQSVEKWADDKWLIESGFSAFYLIDGQQRLTTSIILINQILKRFDLNEGVNFNKRDFWIEKFLYKEYGYSYKSYIFGYEIDNPSDEFFKTKILEQKSSGSDKVPEQTLYTENLDFANKYFDEKLQLFNKIELENIFKKLVNKLKFNFYEIDDELDIFVTFETMNNRGKKLSNLELLKNRLIYLSTIIDGTQDLKDRLRKDINETWKTIYEYLGKNKENPLDDDDFLYNHWIMFFTYNRNESSSYAKYLLNEKFTAKNVIDKVITIEYIKKYIYSLNESSKAWFHLYNISSDKSPYNTETKIWFEKLNRLGMRAFPPLFMAVMVKKESKDKLINLLMCSEKFIFLVFCLSQRKSNTKNSHFYRISNLYYFDEISIDKIIDQINEMTSGGYLNDEGEYVYTGLFDFDMFKKHIDDLFTKDEGYYSWNAIRYFLYEYELFLQSKTTEGNEKVAWVDFNKRKKEDTIEHIYPQTATDEYWVDKFKNLKQKQKKEYLHSLGNLVLLSRSKNSELQNKNFNYKKSHENNEGNSVGFFNGSYSEISVSQYEEWTPVAISKRGGHMLQFMQERWSFKIEDWDITIESLLHACK